MNILAIDTATEQFSVALCSGKDTWLFEADAGLRHSELIMDSIDTLFKMAGLKPEDLSGIVCTGGPGSFTGLRIGFATAKGLALSLGIPFAAIPTLDCMARPLHFWPGIAVPVLDAKKKAFFCALYSKGKKLSPDMDSEPLHIANTIAAALAQQESGTSDKAMLFGPGASLLYDALTQSSSKAFNIDSIKLEKDLRWGNAQTLLRIAEETNILQGSIDYSSGPEYIRKSDAELTKTDG
jgi:tRNA threonylcarbamoyladenosine biosynthesis protein TsaB